MVTVRYMNDIRKVVVPTLRMGDRLRVVRREYMGKISQAEMSAILGVPRERYSQWESGGHEPRPADARRIANLLELRTGVSAAWILGVYENGPSPDGGGPVAYVDYMATFGRAS